MLEKLGLNERQLRAVKYVKEKGKITNKEYQYLNNVPNETAYIDLSDVVKRDMFAVEGIGRNISYILKK